jgi:subtilisin family serine protease
MLDNVKCRHIRIAIIDSGIDPNTNNLNSYITMQKTYRLNNKGKVIELFKNDVTCEHGTAIAMIIKYICNNIEFFSLSILDQDLSSDGRLLIYALNKAIELSPDIIHLSLGTRRFRYKLRLKSIIKRANKRNIIIVTALSNDGKVSYPSKFKNVIAAEGVVSENPFTLNYEKNIFYAPISMLDIDENSELKRKNIAGNSISAAYVSGHIANILLKNKISNFDELQNYMKMIKTNVEVRV